MQLREFFGGLRPLGRGARVLRDAALVAVAGKKALRWSLEGKAGKPETLHSGKKSVFFLGACPGGEQIFYELETNCGAVDASGATLWCQKVTARPSLVRGELFLRRYADLAVLDATTGELRRTLDVPEVPLYGGYHAGRGAALVALVADRVQLRDARTGALLSADEGHKCQVQRLEQDPAGGRFATSSRHSRVCVWSDAGALEHTLVPRLPGSGHRPAAAVHLTPEGVYTGFANAVQRFDRNGTPIAESQRLKSEVSLLVRVPGRGLLAATARRRRSYGELALLDPETLEIRQRARCDRTFERYLETEGATTLLGNWCHARLDWDTLEVEETRIATPDFSRKVVMATEGTRFLEYDTRMTGPNRSEVGSFWLRDVATGETLLERTHLDPIRTGAIDGRGERAVLAYEDRLAVYLLAGGVHEVSLVGLRPSFVALVRPDLAFVADRAGRSALVSLTAGA